MENQIIIKFDKAVIQSRTHDELTLKSSATQDNFLNQFTYCSIVTDAMLAPKQRINPINFENLIGICYVVGLSKMVLEEKKHLAEKMAAYEFVEYAYVETDTTLKLTVDPMSQNIDIGGYKKSDKIPNFTNLQYYKEGKKHDYIGIDMEYAWSLGIAGQGICISTTEYGPNHEHSNLNRNSLIVADVNNKDDHATATAGILYAKDVGFGIKGLVYQADTYYAPAKKDDSTVKKIARTLEVLRAGDIAIYEMQSEAGPIDYDLGVWDLTQEALKAGIIVIMAGGNNGEDLDAKKYEAYRNRPDYGAIRVGAGDALLNKADFSTYGSMIHLQGWGTWNVVTTGCGSLYDGGPNNNYSYNYGGTASATPIVASAAVALQSWYKQQTGEVLSPFEMRGVLIETGIAQADEYKTGKHIGPIPNIRNAIQQLRKHIIYA